MEKPIHIVITYVDGNDPEWQAAHTQYVGESVTAKRFRDWGTLPFLLRAIEQHMPFVSDVWLVVSSDSQVPAWVDHSQLHIVRHSDIIPAEYLPTFNSATIEMFLYRIPGLSERFLYFNDDCFPMKPCKETDFFQGDKVVVGHTRQWITAGNNYRLRVRNSSNLARRALGLRETKSYVRPQHTCIPMLTSQCEALMAKMGDEIGKKITRTRSSHNYNQYIFSDYLYYQHRTINRKLSNKHFSLAVASIDQITRFLAQPTRQLVCINDVEMSDAKYALYREQLLAAFGRCFPEKSRFEL